MTFVPEPARTNPLMRLGIFIAERITGHRMEPARLLAWSPRSAIGAGVLEATQPSRVPGLSPRTLKLARLTTSLAVNCAFCIDMNASGHRQAKITDAEVHAIRDGREAETGSFTQAEKLLIAYARSLSATPVIVDETLRSALAAAFTPRQLVDLTQVIAAVNFWARLNQGLGVQPAGFADHCLTIEQK